MSALFDSAQIDAYRSLRVNRDYRRWFWSSLGSSFGDWLGLFALQVLVVSLADPGSRLALFGLGGIMMARLLPSVLFGPPSGVFADRFDRKRLMIGADLGRAALFVWIAFSRELVVLFVLTFIVECVSLLYIAAKNAALPRIVERSHLAEANQLTLLVAYGPLPFGAGAAAMMSWLAGLLDRLDVVRFDVTTTALLVNAATFLLAAMVILRLRAVGGGPAGAGEQPGAIAQLRDGIAFIGGNRLLRALIVGITGVAFGAGGIIALGPEFVRSDLGRSGGDWYGLMTTVGFGLLAGLVAAPMLTRRFRKTRLFPTALTAAAGAALAAAAATAFWLVQAVGFGLGVSAGIAFVTGYTLIHERAGDEVRGRTFASFYASTRAAMFAALGLGPFLAGAIGRWTLGAAGVELTLSGVRVTMWLAGAIALLAAAASARGMLRSAASERGGDFRASHPAGQERARPRRDTGDDPGKSPQRGKGEPK